MYAQHQPELARLGRASPEGFKRIAIFVLLTIRVPLYMAVADYRQLRCDDNRRVRSLFGIKHAGLDYIEAHAGEIWEACEYIYEAGDDDEVTANALLRVVTQIPGIGPAKGGFILQMLYGLSGCIDTHNLTRFGLDHDTFHARTKKATHKLIPDYNAFCHKVGTAKLWDGWCTYLAEQQPLTYHSADAVSALHLVPLEC